jgi:hypothetical protein
MISLPVRVRARAEARDSDLAPFPLCYRRGSRCHEIRNSGAPVKVFVKRSRHHPMSVQRVRKESPPPLHVDACQLPRHFLGRFLSLQYLAVVN